MRRLRLLLSALVIGVLITALSLLPATPRALTVASTRSAPVRGVMHVHSRRSDGTGTVDQIAAAASRAGLSFVIFTDHGDMAREAEAPSYRNGVLCINAVEVSTTGGHVIALGLTTSPYPLGGEPRDVVEDIARLGGMSIAAHPTSAKPALRWRDWAVPIDGLEWLNGDSEWRDERATSLGRALLTYPFRQPGTLATLLDRPNEALQQWDALSVERPVVGVAGSDAHARIGWNGEGDPYQPRLAVHVPAYEEVFRTFSVSTPGITLAGDAATDAKAVLQAIRRGRVFSSIDALAGPAVVSFTADGGGAAAQLGDSLRAGAQFTFHVDSNAPADAEIALLRDGQRVARASGARLVYSSTDLGAYRVEIQLPNAPGTPPIPWVVTNPIYVRAKLDRPVAQPDSAVFTSRYQDGPADGWRVEKSADSQGVMNVVPTIGGTQVTFRFGLGGSEGENPFVGLVMPVGAIGGADRIAFNATASRPMRVSVQLRTPNGASGERWHRSIYLDENPRRLVVRFAEMTPVGTTSSARPTIDRVSDVLWVVDTVNASPGANGQIWLDDVKYGR